LKRREFDNLDQKDKTIMRYVKEFTLLSHYATDIVNTDEKRKKRFMRGLHPMAKMQLRMLKAADFRELVDAPSLWKMISSKFKRNAGRKQS
jgi:UDP-galactopyranose mutase